MFLSVLLGLVGLCLLMVAFFFIINLLVKSELAEENNALLLEDDIEEEQCEMKQSDLNRKVFTIEHIMPRTNSLISLDPKYFWSHHKFLKESQFLSLKIV